MEQASRHEKVNCDLAEDHRNRWHSKAILFIAHQLDLVRSGSAKPFVGVHSWGA